VGDVQILLGNGDGTFGSPIAYAIGGAAIRRMAVAADLNHDGKLDLLCRQFCSGQTISVLLGNGDGTFASQTIYNTSSNPFSIAVADFGLSGYPDLVTSEATGRSQVFTNNGDGTFGAPQSYFGADGGAHYFVAIGDFNGDGRPDFAALSDANVIDVFLSQPTEQVTISGVGVAGAGVHNVVASLRR
jgi:hypothetical protein